jgi:hypothetical protein
MTDKSTSSRRPRRSPTASSLAPNSKISASTPGSSLPAGGVAAEPAPNGVRVAFLLLENAIDEYSSGEGSWDSVLIRSGELHDRFWPPESLPEPSPSLDPVDLLFGDSTPSEPATDRIDEPTNTEVSRGTE